MEEEIARCRRQLLALSARAEDLEQEFHETDAVGRRRRGPAAADRPAGDGRRAGLDGGDGAAGPHPRRERAAADGPPGADAPGGRLGQRDRRAGEPGGRRRGGSRGAAATASPSWTGNWSAWRPTWTSCAAGARRAGPPRRRPGRPADRRPSRTLPDCSRSWPPARASWAACSSGTARPRNGPPCSKNWSAATRGSARA